MLDGIGLAAIGALALQSLGGWYIDHVIVDASAIYGTFAIVIGLLTWFWLVSHLLLIAAEVNVVLHCHLWPRALTGKLEPAACRPIRRPSRSRRRRARRRRR
ncbi:MAG: YhjD/YihY/BrkB family envelope integrity protein [Solirubrobacteraceae bacterium]